MSKNNVSLTREELYKQVWETPMSKLAKQYGISDRGLAKICKRHKIPMPGLGYWARKAAGKHVIQYKLPAPDAKTSLDIVITPTPPQLKPAKIFPEIANIIDTGKLEVVIPEKLISLHPIIKSWLVKYNEPKPRKPKSPHLPDFSSLHTIKPLGPIDRRRHKILHVIFTNLEKNGYMVKSDGFENAYFDYQGIKIEFGLREKLKQIKHPLTEKERIWHTNPWRLELQPTGELMFTIKTYIQSGLQHDWRDRQRKTLEEQLPDIITTLIASGPMLVEKQRQREEESRIYKEKMQRRHEREMARQKDNNQWRKFLETSTQWQQANIARNFISALENTDLKSDQQIANRTIDEWLNWAKDWSTKHDPLSKSIEQLFKSISEVDSETY